jgi:hypothetical protein
MVSSQQRVFVLKTKEAQSIGNSINALDSLNFWDNKYQSRTTGYISESIMSQAIMYRKEINWP